MIKVRGVRGATTVQENTASAIAKATEELLSQIIVQNDIQIADICSITFTQTADLDAMYPAEIARKMGWLTVPLLCMQEANIKGSLSKCIRVMVHINTEKKQEEVKHIYLKEAAKLRMDLS